jgi:divalent metal cation (Fe/Co/Zn/Cd) transporter
VLPSLTNTNLQDHHFDVVTNVVGLVAAVLGDKFYWWIDPIGAILLAIYTISNWSGTVMENAGRIHLLLPSTFFNRPFCRKIVHF